MNIQQLEEVREACRVFLETNYKARKGREEDSFARQKCKETAACRRESMNLTRALSKFRKP